MVNIYKPVFDDEEGETVMLEDDGGDWVRFADWHDLNVECSEVKEKFEQLKGLIEDINWEAGKIRV